MLLKRHHQPDNGPAEELKHCDLNFIVTSAIQT